MAMANTQAYYDKATITAVKSFIVQALWPKNRLLSNAAAAALQSFETKVCKLSFVFH
jgi:hypothetical protein